MTAILIRCRDAKQRTGRQRTKPYRGTDDGTGQSGGEGSAASSDGYRVIAAPEGSYVKAKPSPRRLGLAHQRAVSSMRVDLNSARSIVEWFKVNPKRHSPQLAAMARMWPQFSAAFAAARAKLKGEK